MWRTGVRYHRRQDPLSLYHDKVNKGALVWDEAQIRGAAVLKKVLKEIQDYRPEHHHGLLKVEERNPLQPDVDVSAAARHALVSAQSLPDLIKNLGTPRGTLLVGAVGSGKTTLLDLFYHACPLPARDEPGFRLGYGKQRHHYHTFMLALYRKVWEQGRRQREVLDGRGGASFREDRKALATVKGWKSIFNSGRPLAANGTSAAVGGGVLESIGQMLRTPSPAFTGATVGSAPAATALTPGPTFQESMPNQDREYVLYSVAQEIYRNGPILCFDEVQLVDVAGAGLIRGLLAYFWRMGGVVVGTSNRVPQDLYQSGVHRDSFLEFLAILSDRCPPHDMRSETDWRKVRLDSGKAGGWFRLDEPEEMEAFAERCAELDIDAGLPTQLNVYGRHLKIPQAKDKVARFSFKDLCELPLGPADYLTLASTYSTLILTHLPRLSLVQKNEARRLITLVDALYESKCQLIVSAHTAPDQVFFSQEAAAQTDGSEQEAADSSDMMLAQEAMSEARRDRLEPYRPNISSYKVQPETRAPTSSSPVSAAAPDYKTLAIFTGQDEQFAFARAVSRLWEMQSLGYRQEPWRPVDVMMRTWERPSAPAPAPAAAVRQAQDNDAGLAEQDVDPETQPRPRPRSAGPPLSRKSPTLSTVQDSPPPAFKDVHFWGVSDEWGPAASTWGQGVKRFLTRGGQAGPEEGRKRKKKD